MECAEWIALADVIITAILTAIIIIQTGRLNKKQQANEEQAEKQQQAFEKELNQQQIELQKRQIQVDTFPYKREIYKYVFSVIELCRVLREMTTPEELKGYSAQQLYKFFEAFLGQYIPDKTQALWSMREAEYILPENINKSVADIRKHFDNMCHHFNVPFIYGTLKVHGLNVSVEYNVDEAIKHCDAIIDYAWLIQTLFPLELNIANLNR